MGYKLAGYEHLGGVEIDPKVAAVYKANHKPKHLYVEDIRAFNERTDLPDELFSLDLLDGSPPCSSFSMAGSREKGWGKEKVFREGQAHQRLDDLVFTYVDTIAKLRPKVAILENVKGLLAGNAKAYAKEIVQRLRGHGYTVQVFLLNAATMGVPQMRERCFFIARLDASWPSLVLKFDEPEIAVCSFAPRLASYAMITAGNERHYAHGRQKNPWPCATRCAPTQVATKSRIDCAISFPGDGRIVGGARFTDAERLCIQSYPQDYKSNGMDVQYLVGMSVPPVMTAQIAHQINIQWLSKLSDN